MAAIKRLEGIFSLILGLFLGILIGIGFLFRAIWRIITYSLRNLIGLLIPSLRYRLRLNWLLRDVEHGKDSRLHIGMFRTKELHGAETDKLFVRMKRCMEQYQEQKSRRGSGGAYAETDRLFPQFMKQYALAAETINWDREDLHKPHAVPAYDNMAKALDGMEALLAGQEAAVPQTGSVQQ